VSECCQHRLSIIRHSTASNNPSEDSTSATLLALRTANFSLQITAAATLPATFTDNDKKATQNQPDESGY